MNTSNEPPSKVQVTNFAQSCILLRSFDGGLPRGNVNEFLEKAIRSSLEVFDADPALGEVPGAGVRGRTS